MIGSTTDRSITSEAEPGVDGGGEVVASADGTLPTIGSAHQPDRVVPVLEDAAKRGKLPGFRRVGESEFAVDAFGTPFDYELRGRVEPASSSSRVRFALRRKGLMPIVFALVLVLTVEPGRYFADQLIPGEWGWINTMWWYYPLTILPLPWVWLGLWKRSRASAVGHASEQIEKMRRALEATPARSPGDRGRESSDHSGAPLERS